MADFCCDCTKNILGVEEQFNDFVGLVDEEDVDDGFLMPVLCEGCGWIMVNHLGKKISTIEEAIENGFGIILEDRDIE